MKRSFFIILTLLTVLFASCESELDQSPLSTISPDNFYRNEADCRLALNAVYSDIGNRYTYGEQLPIQFMVGTDEAVFSRSYNSWTVGLYIHNASTVDLENTWRTLYRGINSANILLENLPNADFSDESRKLRYEAETRFIRAFYYFELVRWWGGVPLRTSSVGDAASNDIARTSADKIYEFIITELEASAPNLPLPSEELEYGRVSRTAAWGLLARAYLTKAGVPLQLLPEESYGKVIEYCDLIIDSGEHNLIANYEDVFLNEITGVNDDTEVIFEVQFENQRASGIQEDGKHGNLNGIMCQQKDSPYGYAFTYAGLSLINSYDQNNDDRYDWNIADFKIDKKGAVKTQKNRYEWFPGKFKRVQKVTNADGSLGWEGLEPGDIDKNYTGINFPILRYADILLMKAEALNNLNRTSEAIPYLNMIRNRAGLADIDASLVSSVADFHEELMTERLREFCFEGIRKHDLIRWGVLVEKLQELKTEMQAANIASSREWLYRSSDNVEEKHYLLPIPLKEMNENKLIEQNPLWK
ncbi:hypothetical protein DF185_09525 [Marinifilum breve]|uniref:RagB/SusD family nutrient uptake outer membrane protein n=1 Tax=Marinifilum breve TaxID=2184082 RepID=A0A2V3ZZ47_9BACT|nr:RagB/SusD family nutrient uptake outer membrane protein [Marinifilum breve]PXY01698.1 hypothetical protein DF185_09525 [Marinifilum breve]